MRVVLRDPDGPGGEDYQSDMTVGREYEVLVLDGRHYRLLSDQGRPFLYPAANFTVTDPTESPFWVSLTDSEGGRHAGPAGWLTRNRNGPMIFQFEDYFDGVPAVVARFWADLPRFYPWAAARHGLTGLPPLLPRV